MLSQSLIPELQQEAASTRKMLERVPFDQVAWRPHQKSMTFGQLAAHVAELAAWITMTLNTTELDWQTFDYKPFEPRSAEELLGFFDSNVAEATSALQQASDEALMAPWTMRKGEQVYFTMPRIAVIRTFAMNHTIHHRAQLSVYLRLQDVPVPGMYGPTADEF